MTAVGYIRCTCFDACFDSNLSIHGALPVSSVYVRVPLSAEGIVDVEGGRMLVGVIAEVMAWTDHLVATPPRVLVRSLLGLGGVCGGRRPARHHDHCLLCRVLVI